MGNKLVRLRESIDDCTLEGSGFCKDADQRKSRLNMNGELAPHHSGAEEYAPELDECPICFLFYPSLNRSSCCSKSICTECYMQIKSAEYSSQANCPFCKTTNYMVEYNGAKTEEEKFCEQAEEQKVIEAKIRIRQKELRDEEDSLLRYGKRIPAEETYVASRRGHMLHADDNDNWNLDQFKESFELEESQLFEQNEFDEEHGQQEIVGHSSGEDGAPMDMEQALLMKAIWLSIQDQAHRNQVSAISPQTFHGSAMQGGDLKRHRARSSGLEESAEMRGQAASGSEILLGQATLPHMRSLNSLEFNTRTSTIEIPQRYSDVCEAIVEDKALALGRRNIQNLSSSMQEGSHNVMGCLSTGTAYVIPETYDEQIMLAVALSLADEHAQGR